MKRSVILYIAASLDGKVAKKNGDLNWLYQTENDGDNGYYAFMKQVDTTIMGRTTYDEVLGFDVPFPYDDYENYVVTSHAPKEGHPEVTFVDGDIVHLVENLKEKEGKDIFLIGGGNLIAQFLEKDLVDELILSVAPVLIGEGVPLFSGNYLEKRFKLSELRQYKDLVQMHYVAE